MRPNSSSHDDNIELSRLQHTDESRERLLDEEEPSLEDVQRVLRSRRRQVVPVKQGGGNGFKWWMPLVFLAIVFVGLTVVAPLVRPRKESSPDNNASTRRSWSRGNDDYLLSSDWDFAASPQLREYSWTIEDAEINPDGVYRYMMLINGQYPGPLIRINEGDSIKVTVKNNAQNATSIHWHGLYQNGTNHMDGTVGISQCPIAPGQSFSYEFKVQGQSGTYWYHGHHGMQLADGLYGPLIVHARNEKEMQRLEYATDRVIMLSDHYHDVSGALTRQYLAPDNENTEPVPDTGLINGKAIRDCSQLPHRRCDNSTVDVAAPHLDLTSNARHRLRIINTGAFAEFQFQIDEHELSVTEVDGTDVIPTAYHRLNINPAQRYSVIVHTNVSSSDSFWMRSRMITHCFTDPQKSLRTDTNAVFRYVPKAATEQADVVPTSKDWEESLALTCRDLNTTELVPVQTMAAPAAEDAFFYLRSNFEIGDWRLSRGMFNTSSWRPDHRSPTLHRTLAGLTSHSATFQDDRAPHTNASTTFVNDRAFHRRRELVIQSTGLQVIDLLIHNFDDGNHPMHLHGYKFFVLASGKGAPQTLDRFRPPSDRANVQPLYDSLDLSNPLRRDTATVEAYGWILLRFVADNPGAWPLHCHVGWHTEAGLLMQFITRSDVLETLKVPADHVNMCRDRGVERGRALSDEEYIAEAKKAAHHA